MDTLTYEVILEVNSLKKIFLGKIERDVAIIDRR